MNPVTRTSNTSVFKEALLPEGNKRWGSFGAGMMLEAVAFTHGRAPFSLQCIQIPPSDYALDVSPFMNAPKASRG